jgi:hypothetical protein
MDLKQAAVQAGESLRESVSCIAAPLGLDLGQLPLVAHTGPALVEPAP